MGAVYKIKKGCGCKMCKPHKGGHVPKHKEKHRVLQREDIREIQTAFNKHL